MNKIIIIISLLITPFLLKSQIVSDARLWTAISVNKKVNDFEFSASHETRFDENISHIDKDFFELGVSYKITKGLYSSFNYRFARDNDYEDQAYDLSNRIDLGLTYKYKYEQFRFSFRTKYQLKTAPKNKNNPTFIRNKFTIGYKIDKIRPYISYEFFCQLNNEKVINRTRVALGAKYAINNNSAVKLFYTFENKFNVKQLKRNHIWGVSYSIDI